MGGSTRIPAVRELVAEITGRTPNQRLHPDEAVAMGAAAQAELLDAEADDRESTIGTRSVSDITAHGLGVISLNGDQTSDVNNVIIAGGSKVPAQAHQEFYTVVEDQRTALMRITVGDHTDPERVTVITEDQQGVPIPLPAAPYPKESPIRVTISYDVDAIVHVTATDGRNGRSLGDIEIERANNLGPEEVERLSTDLQRRTVR